MIRRENGENRFPGNAVRRVKNHSSYSFDIAHAESVKVNSRGLRPGSGNQQADPARVEDHAVPAQSVPNVTFVVFELVTSIDPSTGSTLTGSDSG